MFRRKEDDVTTTPVVLPRPSKEDSPVASLSESLLQHGARESTQNPGMFGVMQKFNPFKSSIQVPKEVCQIDNTDSPVPAAGKWLEAKQVQQGQLPQKNPGMCVGMMQKINPFKSSTQTQDTQPFHSELSCSTGSLPGDGNMVRSQMPSQTDSSQSIKSTQVMGVEDSRSLHSDHSSSSGSLDESDIERHSIWYTDFDTSSEVKSQPKETQKESNTTFTIRRILPSSLFGSGAKSSSDDVQPLAQETTVQSREIADAPVSREGTTIDPPDEEDGLLLWWTTVEGWGTWNKANQYDEDAELVEQVADRVFMAARLFVRLFSERGPSLQRRVLELLGIADAADSFHKKTVTASVGGGLASVAGSITTITGLVLAPFTAGASLIVTAVGIGVATAGGVTTASANITDTLHSKTDRRKVEKMIMEYQEEIQDIKECLEFLQEGMETLEEWDFEAYAESISNKHLNKDVKHVVKEGGRAGKALLINTENLISTVQVLNVAGNAGRAAQVMSVTTGVMSGLFLALDVFFLAKDSVELKKGAKTEFAAKIREVCRDLQNGLLELRRIEEQLQKTMDCIEVEVEDD